MAPIPRSDFPGYQGLCEKVNEALDRCQEYDWVDFKESGTWEELQLKVIHSVLGMGNLRDGGLIVIGVSQRGSEWTLQGISSEDEATYDVDTVTEQIGKFVSPHVNLDLVLHEYDSENFLVINVHEFDETPLVCKRNGPDGTKPKLVAGALYVRPPSKPQTTWIRDAGQMHDLLELAAEKRARRILEVATRVGMIPAESDRDRFAEELKGL